MSVFPTSSAAATSSLPAAAQWVEGMMLGSLGTALAVVAIALAGLAMLSGRISVRQTMQVILGCFILFGAPALAKGLFDLAQGASPPASVAIPPPAPSLPAAPARPPVNADPYAGAAVPM